MRLRIGNRTFVKLLRLVCRLIANFDADPGFLTVRGDSSRYPSRTLSVAAVLATLSRAPKILGLFPVPMIACRLPARTVAGFGPRIASIEDLLPCHRPQNG
jgi:hypothetical protein